MSGIYLEQVELKEHQKQMIELIKQDYPEFEGRLLDIGCATGLFLKALAPIYPRALLTGIDINGKLILQAEKNSIVNTLFLVRDATAVWRGVGFDIITASGVLGFFEDYEPVLDLWLSWLKDKGMMYIFNNFNSRDIDTRVSFRNNYAGGDWSGGLTSYSIRTISRYLQKCGYGYQFKRFYLNMELPERDDPIRAYTKDCADGTTLILNGANTVVEPYFLIIRL